MSQASSAHRDATPSRSWQLLRPFTWKLALVVVLLCLLTLTDMAQPFFLKLLIDDVFGPTTGDQNWRLLWFILPAMALIYVSRNTLFFASRMLSMGVSEDLCFNLRKRLFEHLQQLSLRFYRANQPGKVSARLMDDTFKIQTFIQDKLPTLIRYFLEFQVLLIIVYMVNWRLALASTLVLPLHLLTYRGFRSSIRASHSEAQERLAVAHGNIVEKFLGMEVVKGFAAEERESTTFREAIDASRRSQMRTGRFTFVQKVIADLLVGLGTVLLLGYGAFEVLKGRMTGGAFLMFFWYIKMLYPAVLEVISGAGHLSKATANVDRVFEMLEQPVDDRRGNKSAVDLSLDELAGPIEYRNASFAYEDDSPLVLDNINFRLQEGEHIAITGPSGCGKSTLISLLPRFNEPTSGQVIINDHPAQSITVRSLRRLFGMVFQEVFLFNTTIMENLRYARPDAPMAEIIEACRVTGAHDFIQRLPNGYYTRIGEEGSELSRGEKQRITLARALVRDPRVLIIDEATASIDSAAALDIIRAILERMEGRTVIMVTHDIELLDLVDRVISVDNGKVAYDGHPLNFPGRLAAAARKASPLPYASLAKLPTQTTPTARESTEGGGDPPRRPKSRGGGAGGVLLALALLVLIVGCVQTTTTTRSIEMEDPRISNGLIIDEHDPVKLRRIAEALDSISLDPSTINSEQIEAYALRYQPDDAPAQPSAELPVVKPATEPTRNMQEALSAAASRLSDQQLPPNAIRLIQLPDLSEGELVEMIDHLALRLNAFQGYADAGTMLLDSLPPMPKGVVDMAIVAKANNGTTDILRLGYQRFLTQPPQLWALGLRSADDESLQVNADVDQIQPLVDEMLQSMLQLRAGLTVKDLEPKLVQLSYVNGSDALNMLNGLGLTVFNLPQEVPDEVNFDQLPYVVGVPEPSTADVGLVAASRSSSGGSFGETSIGDPAQLTANTVATPTTQIMVLFHPARPEQFSRVRRALDEYIDRPARQIFVEGLILEISEEGLKDLGVEWELSEPPIFWKFGNDEAGGLDDSLRLNTGPLPDFFDNLTWDWTLRIRALIRDGRAEILSRPSVLTLNNRQSAIRVGLDIPIATSTDVNTSGSTAKLAFNFRYLSTGILLNVRPRINEDGSEVSMLINTEISAPVPGATLEIRDSAGTVLAQAPTVSSRRVQTYARIKNNTPLIIGGLVQKEHIVRQDKVPLLGDIPLVGWLFRSEKTEDEKREVIIVLTPFVLPEDRLIPRSLPKDEDYFDSFDHRLFRDAYRIRAEDVFDLRFLFENTRFQTYRDLARQAISTNFRLAKVQPFKAFADNSVPGEKILVTRMIYEVVKRLGTDAEVTLPHIIFFEGQQDLGGYDVRFLENTMTKLAGFYDPMAFFTRLPGKALALTFYSNREAGDISELAAEPIPELAIIDCPDRETWATLLWDLNQPDEQGRQRHTILIQDESDIVRLRRALVLKRIVMLNGGAGELHLQNFSVGKVLIMPELKDDQIHVVDTEVARYFFHTEHYYAATIQELQNRLLDLDRALRSARGNSNVSVPAKTSRTMDAQPLVASGEPG